MSDPPLTYTGTDVLETLDRATNYNSLLLDLILEISRGAAECLISGLELERSRSCSEPETLMWCASSLTRSGQPADS